MTWAVLSNIDNEAWAKWAEDFARDVCRKCGGVNFRLDECVFEGNIQFVWEIGGYAVSLDCGQKCFSVTFWHVPVACGDEDIPQLDVYQSREIWRVSMPVGHSLDPGILMSEIADWCLEVVRRETG